MDFNQVWDPLSNLDGTQDIDGILAYQLILQVLEIG